MVGSGRVPARLLAGASAVVWGFLSFGFIDLVTALTRDPGFAEHWILELGWGLLYLVLVAVPLGALVVRPGAGLLLWQLGIVAGSLVLAATIARQPGHLVPAAALSLTALALWFLGGARRPALARPAVPLLVVACGGAVGWSWYAVTMARSTAYDEITHHLTHLPAQAALGFALGAGSVLAAVAVPGTTGHLVQLVVVTGSALLLGVESVVNPGLVGSLGTWGGAAAALWSVALAGVVLRGRAPVPAGQAS